MPNRAFGYFIGPTTGHRAEKRRRFVARVFVTLVLLAILGGIFVYEPGPSCAGRASNGTCLRYGDLMVESTWAYQSNDMMGSPTDEVDVTTYEFVASLATTYPLLAPAIREAFADHRLTQGEYGRITRAARRLDKMIIKQQDDAAKSAHIASVLGQ